MILRNLRLLLLLMLCFVAELTEVYGQMGNIQIINYNPNDYRSLPTNWDIVQDSKGHLYVGNRAVVLHYDGNEWNQIEVEPYLPIRSLAIDEGGTVYVGAREELGYITKDEAGLRQYQSLLDKLDSSLLDFQAIWKTHVLDSVVYYQSYERIIAWHQRSGRFASIVPHSRFHYSYVVRDQLYVHDREHGVHQVMGDSLVLLPGGDFFAGNRIYAIMPFGESDLLIATRNQIYHWSAGAPQQVRPLPIDFAELYASGRLYNGTALPNGNYAFATLLNGILYMSPKGELIGHYHDENGLQSNSVKCIYADRKGNLIAGTARGISCLKVNDAVTFWDARQGKLKGVTRESRALGDRRYVSTEDGIYYLDGQEVKRLPVETMQYWFMDAMTDAQGEEHLLVGSNQGFIDIRKDGSFERVSKGHHLWILSPSKLPGTIVTSSSGGIRYYQHTQEGWEERHDYPAISDRSFWMLEDKHHQVWVATLNEGLYRFEFKPEQPGQSVVTNFTSANGLPSDRGEVWLFLLEDEVMATTMQRLYRFDEQSQTFVLDPRLGEDFINREYSIYGNAKLPNEDELLYRIDIDYQQKRIIRASKQADGSYVLEEFYHNLLQDLFQPSFDLDYPYIWVSADAGLMRFDLSKTASHHPIQITSVYLDQDSPKFKDVDSRKASLLPELAPRDNRLQIHYARPIFQRGGGYQYSYRLLGLRSDLWSAWSTDNTVTWTDLPPGDYRFEVRTKVNPEEIAAFDFTVQHPWYQEPIAYLSYIVLLSLLVYVLIRINVWRLKQQNLRLEEVIVERTDEIVQQRDEIAQQKNRIERQNRELIKINEEKSQLIHIVAHDLKNPLNTVFSLVQLIKDQLEGAEGKSQDYLHKVEEYVLNLTERIDKILDLKAIEQRQLNLQLEPIDARHALQETLSLFEEPLANKRMQVRTEFKQGRSTILADRQYVQEIFENLLSNAIKFTQPGKAINLSIWEQTGQVFVAIQDQGPGILPEEQHLLYEKFTRLSSRPTANERSTGLGLYIVKKFVDAMQASIDCQSQPGQGTRFVVGFKGA